MTSKLPDVSDDLFISYNMIPIERTEEILKFLDATYFKDEPLCRNKDLEEEDSGSLKEDFISMIQQGLSLMAVDDKTGQVIGVALSEPEDRYLTDTTDGSAKIIEQLNLVAFANKSVSVYEEYDVDTIFHFLFLSVHPNYRGFGIATKLVQKSIELAKLRGFKVAKAEATGKYSQKLFTNLDFDILFQISYNDYKVDGEVVFRNMGIHTSFQVLAKKI